MLLATNMTNNAVFKDIYDAIAQNNLQKAEALVQEQQSVFENNATLFYLQGKIHMKRSNWGEAMSSFLKAESLDPLGPAHECMQMLTEIMEFYNKDMYNQ